MSTTIIGGLPPKESNTSFLDDIFRNFSKYIHLRLCGGFITPASPLMTSVEKLIHDSTHMSGNGRSSS